MAAWQAFFLDTVKRDGRWVFSVFYTDGSSKVTREYVVNTISDSVVKAAARSEVAALMQVVADEGKVSISPGANIDLTPPVVDPPSDPDPARTQFLADYRQLQAMQRGVAAGLIAPDDPTLTSLAQTVVGEYKAAYVGLL